MFFIKEIRKLSKQSLLLLLLVFILGDNVLSTLGVSEQIHKGLLFMICAVNFRMILKRGFKINPHLRNLLLFILIYTILKLLLDRSPGSRMTGIIALLPPLIYTVFISIEKRLGFNIYKRIFHCFFYVECGIAIIERIFMTHIFHFVMNDTFIGESSNVANFRSVSLYGHPLQNALVVFIYISFILVYENKLWKKLYLSFIGILAIFCFNSRAAIVMSGLVTIIYIFYFLHQKKNKIYLKGLALLVLIVGGGAVYFLFSKGIVGGRLSSLGLYDDKSAAVRLQALNLFDYYKITDFIFGIDYNFKSQMLSNAGVVTIENFWLNWIFNYGLFFVSGIIIFYIPVLRTIFKTEKIFVKLFLILPFVLLASTNPSLAVSIVPMSTFLLLSAVYIKGKEDKYSFCLDLFKMKIN